MRKDLIAEDVAGVLIVLIIAVASYNLFKYGAVREMINPLLLLMRVII